MNKARQKRKAIAYKRIRNLTVGMQVWTWESNVAAAAADGSRTYHCMCVDRFGQDLSRDVFHVAANICRAWHVRIRVKCRADDGTHYIEETALEAGNLRLDDFTDLYKKHREETINACNPKHVIDVGWHARTLD